MAKFCTGCYIDYYGLDTLPADEVIMSNEEYICELCGQKKRVVMCKTPAVLQVKLAELMRDLADFSMCLQELCDKPPRPADNKNACDK